MNNDERRRIRIDALDTLFFRDGKPFTMGAETWADAGFPPAPSVLYGALRSQYFGERIGELPLANSPDDDDPTRDLKISSIALQDRQERLLFPLPCDLVSDKNERKQQVRVLQRFDSAPASSSAVPQVLRADNEELVEHPEHAFLNAGVLSRYLQGSAKTLQYISLDDYTVAEPKIGIKRQRSTGTVEEGMLYRVDMRRLASAREFGKELQEISFCVEFSGLPIAERGLFRLGGEGKIAAYQPSKAEGVAAPQLQGKRFKLYLATPALFAQGWLPSWIDPKTLQGTGEYQHLGLHLETAVLGKPIPIGGFQRRTRNNPAGPKIMRRAVPAGSVYYFHVDGDTQDAVRAFHQQCISDDDAQQGFGLAFVGGVA